MSLLYPRLLSAQAEPLFREYRVLSVEALMARADTVHESAVFVATGGDRVTPEQLRALREAVVELARGAGFPDSAGRATNADFDLRLAALLHAETGMVPAEAASRDVWAFLALVLLPDVAHWRYPEPPKDRVLGTDLTRHVFGRLWWRAHLVRAPEDPEPYAALRILGEAAFDQIYARRAALGGSSHLVRAILRIWSDLDLQGVAERDALRDFLKRLLRLAPFVLFDGIEEKALDDELHAVAAESVAALLQAQEPRAELVQAAADSLRSAAPAVSPTPVVAPAAAEVTGSSPMSWFTPRPRTEGRSLRSLELFAGCGAQALGLERAGFVPALLIDNKADACLTITANRPHWAVLCADVLDFDPERYPIVQGVDLLSAGMPRLKAAPGADDRQERLLLQRTLDLVAAARPRAVFLENLPDLVEHESFFDERTEIASRLAQCGYACHWAVLNSADFGVAQNRRSGVVVGLREPCEAFAWPRPTTVAPPTVGQVLGPSMASRGWTGAARWASAADRIAPALIGGSDRRGGADLGPTGSKKAWASLGVDGSSLWDDVPDASFPPNHMPRLTVAQAATVQALPEDWSISGGKTSRYRQIGHATPPPVATAVGLAISAALRS